VSSLLGGGDVRHLLGSKTQVMKLYSRDHRPPGPDQGKPFLAWFLGAGRDCFGADWMVTDATNMKDTNISEPGIAVAVTSC
jgi:hypothetical protein